MQEKFIYSEVKFDEFHAQEIIPGLFLGNQLQAKDHKFIKDNRIAGILNMTPDVPNYYVHPQRDIEYMRINVHDRVPAPLNSDIDKMSEYLPHCVSFIEKRLKLDKKPVFVHCHHGCQRSPTAVAAYIMKTMNKSLQDAVNMILEKRPVFGRGLKVNFLNALQKYEKSLKLDTLKIETNQGRLV